MSKKHGVKPQTAARYQLDGVSTSSLIAGALIEVLDPLPRGFVTLTFSGEPSWRQKSWSVTRINLRTKQPNKLPETAERQAILRSPESLAILRFKSKLKRLGCAVRFYRGSRCVPNRILL